MKSEWITTEWQRRIDHETMELVPVTITRMRSPFYEGEKFAVRRGGSVLSKSGKFKYEPMPSSRTKAFYKRFRFDDFESAKAAAEKAIAELERRAKAMFAAMEPSEE